MSARDADLAAALAMSAGGAIAAWAPGRCTLVGDHLDYVGGRVLVCALSDGVAVALTDSSDGRWHVRSGDVVVAGDSEVGDGIARLPLAAVAAVRDLDGVTRAPLDIAMAASLPYAAGLSSSAAITCAVIAALLGGPCEVPPRRLADLAWAAEHDVAGIPCGRLDHRAVVEAPASGVCAVDLGTDRTEPLRWPWADVVLVIAGSGERHDVGAPGYAALRDGAESVMRATGAATPTEVTADAVAALPAALQPRARHLIAETRHVGEAEAALAQADRVGFGRALLESHRDQRELLGDSTLRVDAMVDAAMAVAGCHGARMVGAGFGGSVVAVCDATAAADVVAALGPAARVAVPGPGLAALRPA